MNASGSSRFDEWTASDLLAARPPRQQRSREAWARILAAGIELIEEGGLSAFTVPRVCERAEVAPRAVYERVDGKDELFAAVYEYKMGTIVADQAELFDENRTDRRGPVETIHHAVGSVIALFAGHESFLRAVIHMSATHPLLLDRGRFYTRGLRSTFIASLRHALSHAGGGDGGDTVVADEMVLDLCFATVFSTVMIRTSYGADYATDVGDNEALTERLTDMVVAYLLPGTSGS
ncbi:TetR/AcrR family transcriptional regulator [Gordonia sp. NPDC003424]